MMIDVAVLTTSLLQTLSLHVEPAPGSKPAVGKIPCMSNSGPLLTLLKRKLGVGYSEGWAAGRMCGSLHGSSHGIPGLDCWASGQEVGSLHSSLKGCHWHNLHVEPGGSQTTAVEPH